MFWGVVIDKILLISAGSTGARILFRGLARNLLNMFNVSFDASALVFIPNSHSCKGSLSILRCAEGGISTHQRGTAITCL